ncbi:hypothetical protein [Lysobacter gummosus]|uniref:hypothetical protein n=1 Tax=Lysobacter gummosus TaxID=262324 RepID=UPI0036432FFC
MPSRCYSQIRFYVAAPQAVVDAALPRHGFHLTKWRGSAALNSLSTRSPTSAVVSFRLRRS